MMNKYIAIFVSLFFAVSSLNAQSYFNVEVDFPCYNCGNNYHPTADLSKLKVYDHNIIKSFFENMLKNDQIEFNFPQGGCQQRAQIMSMLLSNNYKIEHAKIWLFAPVDLDLNDKRTLYIKDKNELSPDHTIQWNYHVAPVVLVKQNNKLDTLVIDPSIDQTQPLSLRKWLSAIGNSHISKYTFLNAQHYFFNVQYVNNNPTTVINGYFYDFVNPAKDNLIMEKGLAINDMAIYVLNKYIKPLQKSKVQADIMKLHDLKRIFGNATVLDNLFSQNISGNMEITNRYATNNYGDVILDAKQVFNKRVQYWAGITTALLNK